MRRLVMLLWVLALLFPAAGLAQSNATDGALDGFVKDPSGASVPAREGHRAQSRAPIRFTRSTTDTNGYFRFPLLQVGEYQLIVSPPGSPSISGRASGSASAQQARVDVP